MTVQNAALFLVLQIPRIQIKNQCGHLLDYNKSEQHFQDVCHKLQICYIIHKQNNPVLTCMFTRSFSIHNISIKFDILSMSNRHCISVYSFRRNQFFLELKVSKILNSFRILCTKVQKKGGNYSREETIQGRILYKEIRYLSSQCIGMQTSPLMNVKNVVVKVA